MFDHVFDHIATHGLLGTLSVGIIPSVLLIATLILVLKLIEMNRSGYSGVYKTAAKIVNREAQEIKNKKLQQELAAEEDQFAADGKVNHLRMRIARLKEADEELRNRYGKE
jgi:hypothetical protein